MDLRYPIGQYETQPFSDRQKREWLQDIQFLPGLIEAAIENYRQNFAAEAREESEEVITALPFTEQ